ncbi:MAG: hypothetical protein IJZ66_02235 [Oscillibacter sp.]|nr:hypothetical protein [Oscillibacter sp.]
MDYLNEAIKKIEAQQPKVQDAVWMVGEQLKDMLRREPHLAELVSQDLNCEQMTLAHCEKKLKEFADKNKTKSARCFCVTPAQAERIIREFYGLTEVAAPSEAVSAAAASAPAPGGNLVDLTKYF